MMIMELKAVVADGAVQQLTVPWAIGRGIVEVFVHSGFAIANITDFVFVFLEVLLLVSLVLGPPFRFSTYLMQ